MNRIFKTIMGMFTHVYRLTNGRIGGTMVGLGVLLLTTTGRKSGKERTTPLGFFEEGDEYVIIASNGGADTHPAWYLNLKSDPKVGVQIKDKLFSAVARIATPEQRKASWNRLVKLSPQYGQYAKGTKREIP